MPLPQQQVSQQAQPDVSHAVSASTGAVGVGGNWSAGVVAASYTAPGEVGSWNPDVFGGAK
jgi:hypothetical protein